MSVESQRKQGLSSISILQKIFFRAVKLIALGLIINSSKRSKPIHLEELRFPGVLQRIGVTYLFLGFVYTLLCKSETELDREENEPNVTRMSKLFMAFQDMLVIWKGWICMICVMISYLCIIFLLPVPGCPT